MTCRWLCCRNRSSLQGTDTDQSSGGRGSIAKEKVDSRVDDGGTQLDSYRGEAADGEEKERGEKDISQRKSFVRFAKEGQERKQKGVEEGVEEEGQEGRSPTPLAPSLQ